METVDASFTWPGADLDVLRLFAEPTPTPWGVEVFDEDVVLFRALDERAQPTGQIAGLEIAGFLDFDRWRDLPTLGLRWRLPGWQPLALADLLPQLQAELRAQIEFPALV